MEIDEDTLPDEVEIDRMMLEAYGLGMTDALERRINESTARADGEKRFGVDYMFVFDAEDAAEDIERNDVFDAYAAELRDGVDLDSSAELADVWDGGFLHDELVRWLNGLDKGEVMRYDDFFRALMGRDGEEAASAVSAEDGRFGLMPHVVRIF